MKIEQLTSVGNADNMQLIATDKHGIPHYWEPNTGKWVAVLAENMPLDVTIPVMLDFNQLTEEVAKREGKKINVNIAQIKEITRIVLDILEESK